MLFFFGGGGGGSADSSTSALQCMIELSLAASYRVLFYFSFLLFWRGCGWVMLYDAVSCRGSDYDVTYTARTFHDNSLHLKGH